MSLIRQISASADTTVAGTDFSSNVRENRAQLALGVSLQPLHNWQGFRSAGKECVAPLGRSKQATRDATRRPERGVPLLLKIDLRVATHKGRGRQRKPIISVNRP